MNKLLIYIFISFFLFTTKANGQDNDTLYIEFNKSMRIQEYTDEIDNFHVDLSFSIFSKKDTKITTYNFKVDNINKSFVGQKFSEIQNILPKKEVEDLEVYTEKDLVRLSPCELHYLVSDTDNIYLIKKENTIFYIYRLKYFSTQRGWSYVNTN